MVSALGGCAVRPRLRRQEGEISQPPALATVVVVVVVAVVDRRRQEASLRAAEEEEEAVVRPARVRRRAAVLVLAEEASEEVEAARAEVEPLPVVTLAPELPNQLARNFTKSLLGFRCRCGLPCFREFSLAARHDQNVRQRRFVGGPRSSTRPATGQKASAKRRAEMLLDGPPTEQRANRLRALSSALSRGNHEETRHRAGQIAELKAG
jgi:hypothetical protein